MEPSAGRWCRAAAALLLVSVGLRSASAAPCFEIPGFAVTPDADHEGDNLRVAPLHGADTPVYAAAAACLVDPACLGFNSDGWLKGGVAADEGPVPGTCLYAKVDTTLSPPSAPPPPPDYGKFGGYTDPVYKCLQVPGFVAWGDADHPWDPLGRAAAAGAPLPADNSNDPEEVMRAAAACAADPACAAFNSAGYTKSVASPLVYSEGLCTYIKRTGPDTPVYCPALASDYLLYLNADHNVDEDVYGVNSEPWDGDTMPALNILINSMYCRTDESCGGFATARDAEYYNLLPATPAKAACLYEKIDPYFFCSQADGFTVDTIQLAPGAPLPAAVVSVRADWRVREVLASCVSDAACLGFDTTSWLSALGPEGQSRSFCRYTKQGVTSGSTPSYGAYYGGYYGAPGGQGSYR